VLGVPGLIGAYKAGNVTLANAVGTGVADDKAVYSYMPEIVKFFTGEEPILKNVPTWRCREPEANAYVLDNLDKLVVKEVNGSGGYGMLVGPHANKAQIETFRQKLKASPRASSPSRRWRSRPARPSWRLRRRAAPCRSAPLCALGRQRHLLRAGGLTRVALKEGSLVVNSSQGGGTKDTWLRADMPRSLAACMDHVLSNLKHVRNDVSADTERFAGKLDADLKFSRIEEVFDAGLHDYLTVFLERIFELGNRISKDFLVPLAA
jgi:uncharacterized circularly permuted ATP-grasp superfamily protein